MKAKRVRKLDPQEPLVFNAARILRTRLDEMRSLAHGALQAENETEQPQLSAVNFDIRDTLGNTFEPMTFPPGVNSLIYKPTLIRAGGLLPNTETIQGQGGPRGQVLVFRLKTSAYQNRPLIFTIQPATGERAEVELDL